MAPHQAVPIWHIRHQRSGDAKTALAITTTLTMSMTGITWNLMYFVPYWHDLVFDGLSQFFLLSAPTIKRVKITNRSRMNRGVDLIRVTILNSLPVLIFPLQSFFVYTNCWTFDTSCITLYCYLRYFDDLYCRCTVYQIKQQLILIRCCRYIKTNVGYPMQFF